MYKSISRYQVRAVNTNRASKWIFSFLVATIFVIVFLKFRPFVHNSEIKLKAELTETRSVTKFFQDISNKTLTRVNVVPTTVKNKPAPRTKTILYWSSFLTAEDFYVQWDDDAFKKCAASNCKITKNRSLLATSDALLFHPWVTSRTDLPPFRLPSQKYIFFFMEPPRSSPLLKEYNNFYNWTISYRMDSDIYTPYVKVVPFASQQSHLPTNKSSSNIFIANLGKYRNLKESNDYNASQIHFDYDKFIKMKTKEVAWVVSDCWGSSRREVYAKELSQYIHVDIYGKCGNLSCEKGDACFERLGREYKFYLALENSICKDYVTEKLFNALTHGMVPIVFGVDAHYKMAPPHSFIDAHKFDSPKTLAEYLKQLNKDDKSYKEYLQWNDNFKPQLGSYFLQDGWCDLCEALHDEKRVKKPTVYADMNEYWVTEAQCKYENVDLERKRVDMLNFISKARDLITYGVHKLLDYF